MTNAGKAVYQFFSGFGIPAYDENTVPDSATLPYITYSYTEPEWRESASVSATVWYSGTSFADLYNKVDEIKSKVGEGLLIPVGNGCVYINKDSPFAQQQATDDDKVKAVYLLFAVQTVCN